MSNKQLDHYRSVLKQNPQVLKDVERLQLAKQAALTILIFNAALGWASRIDTKKKV